VTYGKGAIKRWYHTPGTQCNEKMKGRWMALDGWMAELRVTRAEANGEVVIEYDPEAIGEADTCRWDPRGAQPTYPRCHSSAVFSVATSGSPGRQRRSRNGAPIRMMGPR
jgi:hypothetical protein